MKHGNMYVKGICLENNEVERIIMKRVKKATAVRHHCSSVGPQSRHHHHSFQESHCMSSDLLNLMQRSVLLN